MTIPDNILLNMLEVVFYPEQGEARYSSFEQVVF